MRASHPFCFSCGYDLRGLALPRACPECGRLADFERQAQAARRWFAGGKAWFWWLHPRSKHPPGLFYVLHDRSSRRIARRRVFLMLWLPAILSSLVVIAGTTLICWTTVQEPHMSMKFGMRPYHGLIPFCQLWNPRPVTASSATVKHEVRFDWPKLSRYKLSTFFFLGCYLVVPWLALLCGYLPCRLLIGARVRRAVSGDRPDELKRSVRSVVSLLALWMGMALWLWFAWLVVVGVSELTHPPYSYPWGVVLVLRLLLLLSAAVWIAAGMVGWSRLVALDVGRVVFRSRVLISVLLVGIGVGGPLAVGWSLFRWLRP